MRRCWRGSSTSWRISAMSSRRTLMPRMLTFSWSSTSRRRSRRSISAAGELAQHAHSTSGGASAQLCRKSCSTPSRLRRRTGSPVNARNDRSCEKMPGARRDWHIEHVEDVHLGNRLRECVRSHARRARSCDGYAQRPVQLVAERERTRRNLLRHAIGDPPSDFTGIIPSRCWRRCSPTRARSSVS